MFRNFDKKKRLKMKKDENRNMSFTKMNQNY